MRRVQAVKVDVGIGGRTKSLDQRDRAAVSLLGLQLGLIEQEARDGAVHHVQWGVTSLGCAASSRRRELGNRTWQTRTHWHTGTRGMTWSSRRAAAWAMRLAPHDGQKPRRLQLNANSSSWPQSPQRRRRKPWARMPHSRKASNASLTNCCR